MTEREWVDTSMRANQVLAMIAAVLLDRAGGSVQITDEEWTTLNAKYGGQAAVTYAEPIDGVFTAQIETIGSIAQQAGKGPQA